MISTVEVLKVMEAFVNEPNYTVWSDLSCNLGVLSSLLSHTDYHEEIQEFIRDLFTPIGLKLGWDNKPGEGECRGAELLFFGTSVCLVDIYFLFYFLEWFRSFGRSPARACARKAGEGGTQGHAGGGSQEI